MNKRHILIYAGLLMSLSAFSIDIILPSIPQMARDFDVGFDKVQWTISLFIVAVGVGQLFWGLISDRFGRKPAIFYGLLIYVVGSAICAFAPNADTLIIARLLQGFGAAAAVVCSRAIIRDMYQGNQLSQAMATATAIFAFGPIVAPFFGAGISATFGWSAIFFGLLFFGTLLTIALSFMPETNDAPNSDAMTFQAIKQSTHAIWQNPQSRYFLLLCPFAMAPMFVILTMLPAIYATAFGIEGLLFAFLFALHGLGIIAGQLLNRRLIKEFGTIKALIIGSIILTGTALVIAAISLFDLATAMNLTVLNILFATSYLIVVANATSLYLDPQGKQAGYASAVFSSFGQLGAGLFVTILVVSVPFTIIAMAFAILFLCATSLIGALIWWFQIKNVLQS